MFAGAVVPAIILVVGIRKLHETLRWLVAQRRPDEARVALLDVGMAPDVADREIADIRGSLTDERGARLREFLEPGLRAFLVVGVVLGVAQQLTGANTVLLYAPRVPTEAGFVNQDSAILATALVGAANLGATLLALALVDTVGREPLLVVGFAGMASSLVAEVLVFLVGEPDPVLALILLVFTLVAVPETKGRTLEAISSYWYARRTWPEDQAESHPESPRT